jgi:diguanylate cyclase
VELTIQPKNIKAGTASSGNFEEFNWLMETSYQSAKRLIPFMAKKRIPLTPNNYRLFFDYFEGENVSLKQLLDKYLKDDVLFTPEVSDKLYNELYNTNEERAKSLSLASKKFESVSEDLGKNLDKTLNATGHYRQILSDSVSQLNSSAGVDSKMQGLLESLLEETKYALNDQSDLANHIESTNRIIATLTSELRDQTMLANMDELTKLYNRRYFSVRFQQMKEEAGGSPPLLCVAIFDLDHFKAVNDTFGPPIGDKVLILCAKILQATSSDDCLPVRYGGEEFIILCRGKELEDVRLLAEGVRQKVAATEVMVRGRPIPITISCGVSRYRDGEDLTDFIERADQALYRAKSSGRNRVVLERPPGADGPQPPEGA